MADNISNKNKLTEKDIENVSGGMKFAKYFCYYCCDPMSGHHWKADFKHNPSRTPTQVIICDSCHDKLINDNHFSNWIECEN